MYLGISYDATLFPNKTDGVSALPGGLKLASGLKHSCPQCQKCRILGTLQKPALVFSQMRRERLLLPVSASLFVCTADASRAESLATRQIRVSQGGPSQKIGIHNFGEGQTGSRGTSEAWAGRLEGPLANNALHL